VKQTPHLPAMLTRARYGGLQFLKMKGVGDAAQP
jgi:hypothetical protein